MQLVTINATTGQTVVREMTPAEQQDYDARQAQAAAAATARQQAADDEATRRQLVIATVQSAVGVNITALTAAQRNGLIVALLYKLGAIDKTGVVLPLAGWL